MISLVFLIVLNACVNVAAFIICVAECVFPGF